MKMRAKKHLRRIPHSSLDSFNVQKENHILNSYLNNSYYLFEGWWSNTKESNLYISDIYAS